MNSIMLETSQILGEHPIIREKDSYKLKYINVLEYFVRKYSKDNLWAKQTLKLYIKKLLGSENGYQYCNFDLQQRTKAVLATKFRPFKFFTYRFCLIFDCIFMCAYDDRKKGEQIFGELSSMYNKRYQKKIRRVFDFLYDSTISVDDIEQVQYLKKCWIENRKFVEEKPIKVIVTANMSAGKSTLLNALVGKRINKTKNEACTAKIHYIVSKPYEDGFCYESDYLLELDADYSTLMEDNPDNINSEIIVGSFFRTVGKESKRIWFIDTPGVNSSQNAEHKELAEKTIINTDADLLIYLLNSENIGTEDDRKHLIFILENYHGEILFVVNKLDRFRKKEDSVSGTLGAVVSDLKKMGFECPKVVPISSYAAYLAKLSIFGEQLNEDEQDELDRISRKMKKEEYQFDSYYPVDVQNGIYPMNSDENFQMLMHSGVLQLENIIYNMR